MKTVNIKSLIAGILIGSIGITGVYAAGVVKSAAFTDSKFFMKGREVTLNDSLAVIQKDGSDDVKVYAPVRELFEELGYEVFRNEDDSSIRVYPKPEFGVREYREESLALLAADYDEDVYLYTLSPDRNGAVVTYKNISKHFEWICYSPRLVMPQMKVMDYDGDGQKEIAASLSNGSGTYVNIDELHVVKMLDENMTDYKYHGDDVRRDVSKEIFYSFNEKDGKIYIHLQSKNNAVEVDLTMLYPDERDIDVFGFLIYTDYLTFSLEDDGKIKMSVHLCVNTKTSVYPQQVAAVLADVSFSNGKFSLSDVRITGYEPDMSEEANILPTGGLKFLSNTEIVTDDEKIAVSNISKNSWPDYCPVAYTSVLIAEDISGATGLINAKKGYFQTPVGDDLYDFGFQFQLLAVGDTQTYALSDDVKFFFTDAHGGAAVELKDRNEFSEKTADGYTAWEAEIKDNKIISLKNIPLRQTVAYRVISAVTNYGVPQLTVIPVIRNEHPSLLNNYRFDEMGFAPATFKLAPDVKIFFNDFSGSNVINEKPGTFTDFSQGLINGRYCYLSINAGLVTEINSIYIP